MYKDRHHTLIKLLNTGKFPKCLEKADQLKKIMATDLMKSDAGMKSKGDLRRPQSQPRGIQRPGAKPQPNPGPTEH